MSIPELIDLEVMRHLSAFGCIKNMDPFAQHLVKTSDEPVLRFRRWWMRKEALRQCLEAHKEQPVMNEYVAKTPVPKGTTLRQQAIIHPYFMGAMARRDNASWNDRDFLGYVKREEPKIFPKRETT